MVKEFDELGVLADEAHDALVDALEKSLEAAKADQRLRVARSRLADAEYRLRAQFPT